MSSSRVVAAINAIKRKKLHINARRQQNIIKVLRVLNGVAAIKHASLQIGRFLVRYLGLLNNLQFSYLKR